MRRFTPSRFFLALLCGIIALPLFLLQSPQSAEAAASLFVSSPGAVNVGDTVTITIRVNTGGQSANAFEGHLSYSTSLWDDVRGTYSGSVCTLPITQPDPSGGSADFSCGTPAGFNGSGLVATVILKAKAAGTGFLGLSGCSVLANDGLGTDITGGCSGGSTQINGSASSTPTPTPSATPQTTPTPTPTPKTKASSTPKSGPSATPSINGVTKPVEKPATPSATPTPEAPAAQSLPPSTPSPADATDNPAAASSKRTISQAVRDIFNSFKDIKGLGKDLSGIVALLLTVIPVLGLFCAILFMIYRLYILERRRRRTLDRLFEMELSELASLEGKMDLLAEKGSKGREQYRDEFHKVKENILRQLKPDYGKPVEEPKAVKPDSPEKK